MSVAVRPVDGGGAFGVKAQPRARRPGLAGGNGCLRVAVREPAEDGRANAAVLATIALALRVRRASVELVSGARSSRKVVAVRGLAPEEIARRLEEACA